MTETLVQRGVDRVLDDLQRGDHLQATVTLEEFEIIDAELNTVTPSA